MYRLGIDTGGTNTDVVLTNIDTGRMYYAKTPTTPKALMDGIMNGIQKIVNISGLRNDEIDELVYGTTIVVNMIAQKENEATALITTRGFKEEEMREVARFMGMIARDFEGNKDVVSEAVKALTAKFPLYE